jgi:hypothetical protein
MNPFRLTRSVSILSTNNDTGVVGLLPVQTDKITAIDSHHCPRVLGRKGKNLLIAYTLSGIARLLNSQYVMSQSA